MSKNWSTVRICVQFHSRTITYEVKVSAKCSSVTGVCVLMNSTRGLIHSGSIGAVTGWRKCRQFLDHIQVRQECKCWGSYKCQSVRQGITGLHVIICRPFLQGMGSIVRNSGLPHLRPLALPWTLFKLHTLITKSACTSTISCTTL